MHPNPIYHDADRAQNLDFARTRAFGVLAVSTAEAPLISHVPFLLSEDGTSADLHLVRSNPITRVLKTPQAARLAVSGPDGYVSPDWYGLADQVPTWNYVAVHLTGRLEQRPQDELLGLLDRQSAFYEARLLPKPPWHSDKMEPKALERMMRMIAPVRLSIETVEGTWKLSQNKPEPARTAVADQITTGFGAELDDLARMMRP
ncbi:FMN-binding negative transcriptional regulator [Pseudophaeobacter sp. A-200-2]|uniref:FMN-binding negative transcriptional regulator n=1 Tax=Pseudophaeobacter sp. A-200-2 TaxID=3098145 RepID=UPI0034D49B09